MCTVRCCCEMRFHHWVEEGKERSKKVSNESKKRSSGVVKKALTSRCLLESVCVKETLLSWLQKHSCDRQVVEYIIMSFTDS
mmetsp:Transcript_17/g.56  ORF Transcript_17/g.56 Transcript_17/m.56 type:complete len:82 (-) Transcript_17:513-758(-)